MDRIYVVKDGRNNNINYIKSDEDYDDDSSPEQWRQINLDDDEENDPLEDMKAATIKVEDRYAHYQTFSSIHTHY